jgi:4-alpha-glucanotransferase
VLAELARELGVQRSYVDAAGKRQRASEDAVAAVCAALTDGMSAHAGAAQALAELREERAERLAEPVAVVWDGRETDVPLAPGARGGPRAELILEGGTPYPGRLQLLDGAVRLPAGLAPGIHGLLLTRRGRQQIVHVISAPAQVHQAPARRWGSFVPLYALPGRFGVGDFDSLRRLVEWTARHGGAFAGTTPIFATFLDQPFDPSPYAPVSRLYWNELHIDPTAAPELERSPEARELLGSPGFQKELAGLSAGKRVDYRGAMAAKRRVLELLAETLDGDASAELAALGHSDPDLLQYAIFRARCEEEGVGWRNWHRPGRFVNPDTVRYHVYVQRLCREQLAHAGDRLYLDMPLGVHAGGFDTWRHRDVFVEGVSVGAPPDPLFQGGQDWGFPPLHPARMRQDGHAYWLACLRTLLRPAWAARIDHVMGLHRLYCVPHGFPATDGVYVRMPAEELYALLSLESHRAGTALVGEDLGTVPDEVRRSMRRHGMLRSYVLEFQIGEGDPFTDVPAEALAGMNTHDMPTFAGFWEGEDIDRRVNLGLTGPDEARREQRERAGLRRHFSEVLRARGHRVRGLGSALDASLAELAESRAQLLVVNVEDLWEEREPQNVPGTGFEAGNWQRRAAYGPDEIDAAPGALRRIEAVAAERGAQG